MTVSLYGVVAVYTKLLGVHNLWYVPGAVMTHLWVLNLEGIEPSILRYVVLLTTNQPKPGDTREYLRA